MPPISPIKLTLLARHPHQKLVGVQLREHLLAEHNWTIAMVLARRLDHEYLLKQHLDAHEMKP
jgi:hypothetical protein